MVGLFSGRNIYSSTWYTIKIIEKRRIMKEKKQMVKRYKVSKTWVCVVVFGVIIPFLCLLVLRYCDFLFYPNRCRDLNAFRKYIKYNSIIDAAGVVYVIWLLVLVVILILWVLWNKRRRANMEYMENMKGK